VFGGIMTFFAYRGSKKDKSNQPPPSA